ncbi:nucleotidyltransferase family protein [Chachezhania antarctica]|uniref:nucleotidyltransferase family protein n=1 Tax=Chachezhania antarctica TaxID=2340860 RepID=UPI0013CEDD62|nr:nucleotidyltransferase family protein [Chachezhania antarctica]
MDLLIHQPIVSASIAASMEINLPNWCIVGGLIRDLAWGKVLSRPVFPRDVDLIYFNDNDTLAETDWELERKLQQSSGLPFRVNNQARMHEFNSEDKYTSVADAMGKFPSTVSAIGISGAHDRAPVIFSIFGYGALFDPVFQITPHFVNKGRYNDFEEYLKRNNLFDRWPEVPVRMDVDRAQ